MKTRRLEIEYNSEYYMRGAPLLFCPEAETPVPAYLYFSSDKDADTVQIVAAHDDGYDDEIPDDVASGKMIRVPVPPNVLVPFLRSIPDDPNMSVLINGMIDGEVLVDYAKYAIEYLISRTPS